MMSISQFLQQLFPRLSASTALFIEEKVRVLHFKNNEVAIKPGAICDRIYLVVEGGFVCRYINEDTETEKTINFYLEDIHPFMACVDSFFSQTPTSCELRAICPSIVWELHRKDLEQLFEMDKEIFNFYNTQVINALTEENELKLKIIALSSEQLYQYILDTFPMVIKKVPSKYIAELMGISAEWLSKLKRANK